MMKRMMMMRKKKRGWKRERGKAVNSQYNHLPGCCFSSSFPEEREGPFPAKRGKERKRT